MFKKLSDLFSKTQNLSQAVSLLVVTVLLSNVLGLIRDMVMTNRVGLAYGSLAPLDKFYAAFVIPDLLYNILIVGALSSAILPWLVRLDTENDQEKFWNAYNLLLSTGVTVIIVGLVIVLFVMPYLTPSLFPGFSASDLKTTTQLTQIMLLSPLFFTLSQISTSALQAKRVFLSPALAPIVYNSVIILGAFLVPKFGIGALVVGVVLGAAGHFLVQLPSLKRHGWHFKFRTGFNNASIRQIGRVMLPRTIALTSTQLLLLIFFRIASRMNQGSITIYQLADDLQTAPVLLLANSLAVAILPDFSRHFANNELDEFKALITKAIRLLIFVFLPATCYLIIYRLPIMNLFIALGHSISPKQVNTAALVFGWFVSSLFFQGAVLILARAFFARGDTVRPTACTVISLGCAWILAEFLSRYTNFGVAGLALSFSVGSVMNAILLWANLGFSNRSLIYDDKERMNLPKIITGTLLSLGAYWIIRMIAEPVINHFLAKEAVIELLVIVIGFFVGTGIYLLWAKYCDLEQWNLLRAKVSNKD